MNDDLKIYNMLKKHEEKKNAELAKQLAAQERKQLRARQLNTLCVIIAAVCLVAFAVVAFMQTTSEHPDTTEIHVVNTQDICESAEHETADVVDVPDAPVVRYIGEAAIQSTSEFSDPPAVVEEDVGETENENELIEEALYQSGYFRSDVPLDGDTQAELRAACEEFGVEYSLMLGIIKKETQFRNIVGDNGKSLGFCQIQPRWWSKLMQEIGAKDLMVPYDNFRTACAIISSLTNKHGSVERALTAYNTGSPGRSAYARQVLAYKAEFDGSTTHPLKGNGLVKSKLG